MTTFNKLFFALSLPVSMAMATTGFSQNCKGIEYDCAPTKKQLDADNAGKEKNKNNYPWFQNNQSRFGTFVYGDTTFINIVVYKGTNYRISFCSPDKNVNGKITFQLTETKTTGETITTYTVKKEDKYNDEGQVVGQDEVTERKDKRVYNKNEVVLYDNTTDNMKQWKEFTTDKTRKITVKVIIPGSANASDNSKNKLSPAGYACVGMLLQHQRGPGATGWK
jgi:hypothetical protein